MAPTACLATPRFSSQPPGVSWRNHAQGVAWLARSLLLAWPVRRTAGSLQLPALMDAGSMDRWSAFLHAPPVRDVGPAFGLVASASSTTARALRGGVKLEAAPGKKGALKTAAGDEPVLSGLNALDLLALGVPAQEALQQARIVVYVDFRDFITQLSL